MEQASTPVHGDKLRPVLTIERPVIQEHELPAREQVSSSVPQAPLLKKDTNWSGEVPVKVKVHSPKS